MIKTTILTLALLASSILNYAKEPSCISTLIINADVTVVLVGNEQASLAITGDKKFMQRVSYTTAGDTLMIEAAGSTYLMGKGTVYVPARDLRNIQINSGATVRSYYSLQVPKLDVVVNGECNLAISNIGMVNIVETEKFSVEQSTELRRIPAGIVKK